jgi:ribonuclease R
MKKDKKSKKGKKSQDKLNKKILSSKILAYFSNNPSKIFNYKQVASKLEVKDETVRNLIVNILTELRDYGAIAEVSRGKYKFVSQGGYVTGKVMLTLKGSGFIIPEEEGAEDIFVNQSNLNHALNGDVVKVYLYAKKRGKQPEGEVVEIIKASKRKYCWSYRYFENIRIYYCQKPTNALRCIYSIRKIKQCTEWR